MKAVASLLVRKRSGLLSSGEDGAGRESETFSFPHSAKGCELAGRIHKLTRVAALSVRPADWPDKQMKATRIPCLA